MKRKSTSEPGTEGSASRDRHHGGQEPPDELQDTPRQNAGYDRAVQRGPALEPRDAMEVDDLSETAPEQPPRE